MISSLYDFAKEWSKDGSVYIISDPHFGDKDMCWRASLAHRYNGIAIDTSEELADFIVDSINAVCGRSDTLIILGDIGDTMYLEKLKAGYKVLIMGNHDGGATKYKYYFDEIYEGPVFINSKLVLSHEPMPNGPWINIHGHKHHMKYDEGCCLRHQVDLEQCLEYYALSINVAAEVNDFVPINLKEFMRSGVMKSIDDIHRSTINGATARKQLTN